MQAPKSRIWVIIAVIISILTIPVFYTLWHDHFGVGYRFKSTVAGDYIDVQKVQNLWSYERRRLDYEQFATFDTNKEYIWNLVNKLKCEKIDDTKSHDLFHDEMHPWWNPPPSNMTLNFDCWDKSYYIDIIAGDIGHDNFRIWLTVYTT